MEESKQKAQRRYRKTRKGKEAARRASAKALEKVKNVRISVPHKEKLKTLADGYNMTQKELVEFWIDAASGT
jgi:hypothetical protein